jgi:REP element-mobilizing transposase RayT
MGDHVHMCVSIPPKYSVASVVGYLKGKSAISIARNIKGMRISLNPISHFPGVEAYVADLVNKLYAHNLK